jgi:predicted amidohydrolase YtcJ
MGNHVALANSVALEKASVDRDTPDPPGGKIAKDPETGEPNGVLIQKAIGRLDMRRPNSLLADYYNVSRYREGAKKASEELVSLGITTIHAIPQNPKEVRAQIEAEQFDDFPLRVHMLVRGWWEGVPVQAIIRLDHFLEMGIITGFGNDRLRVGGIKLSIDGPGGIVRIPKGELEMIVSKAHEAGLRCCIDASNPYAVDWAIEAIEKAVKQNPREDHRHRIEHAGNINCTQERLDRIKELGVIASFQPSFLYQRESFEVSDDDIVPYPTRTMLDMGIKLIANSDWPYPANPFIGIYAMVARKNMVGDPVFPEEKVSVREAIRTYTVDAAYAGFEEDIKGSLEEGKLADMVVLSNNPLDVEPEELLNIKALKTIIGGKIVYEA